ncbi:MAG: glycerol-3-phosphate dehydrogenase/oxidase [Neisseriaceae bacterium]|nr:glycerol-3-phosphate dehydrogenase/oxidase [Neisseriaceae bacterium]
MSTSRTQDFKRLAEPFDLLIIGGGATGLGTALDALSRGLKVALVERSDFAKGTSSKSTKLVHGGVRYLEQLNLKLVRNALLERQYFYKNAPHLSESLAFVIPCYNIFSIPFFFFGLKLYDALAGFPRHQCSSFLSKKETLADFPYLQANKLAGAIQYFDGQFNDAQMAVTLAKTCRNHGGVIQNYTTFKRFIKLGNQIVGGVVQDILTDTEYEIQAKCVINATGIFSDVIQQLDEAQHQTSLTLAQGIHLVAKNRLGLTKALLIPKTSDGRVLFCLPWQDRLILGTTDVKIENCTLEATATQQEVDFILEGVQQYFPSFDRADLLGQFAGVRPLVKMDNTESKKMSREEKILISEAGLVSIIGGKWTTYRHMGEHILDMVFAHGLLPKAPASKTKDLPLSGWLPKKQALSIPVAFRHYGTAFEDLKQAPDFDEKIHSDLPYSMAEIALAIEHGFALTVDDFLARRTRSWYINPKAAIEAAPKVARKMADILGRDDAWIAQQLSEIQNLAKHYVLDAYTIQH